MSDDAPVLELRLYQVDDAGQLYISPAVREWSNIAPAGIDTIIDLEGGLDDWVPTTPDECLYV